MARRFVGDEAPFKGVVLGSFARPREYLECLKLETHLGSICSCNCPGLHSGVLGGKSSRQINTVGSSHSGSWDVRASPVTALSLQHFTPTQVQKEQPLYGAACLVLPQRHLSLLRLSFSLSYHTHGSAVSAEGNLCCPGHATQMLQGSYSCLHSSRQTQLSEFS